MKQKLFSGLFAFVFGAAAFVLWDVFGGMFFFVPYLFIIMATWFAWGCFGDGTVTQTDRLKQVVCVIGNMSWTLEDFIRGWLVTGKTGSGKTAVGLCTILPQLFQRCPDFGCVFTCSKGHEQEMILAMAKHFKMMSKPLVVRTRTVHNPAFRPEFFMNLIGNPIILAETYAAAIIDTAESQGRIGSGGSSDHFKSMAYLHIKNGINLFRILNEAPTLDKLFRTLTSLSTLEKKLNQLAIHADRLFKENNVYDGNQANDIFNHFSEKFIGIPEEERGGHLTTITNSLEPYTHPALVEVFSSENPNARIEMIDDGKILCVSVPPEFSRSKAAIETLIFNQYAEHALSRASLPQKVRVRKNLIIYVADEAQNIMTKNKDGMAIYKALAMIREFYATALFLTQGESSIKNRIGDDAKEETLLNLSNELVFKAANTYGAKSASERLGEKEDWNHSVSWSGGKRSTSKQEAWKPKVHHELLRRLKRFECYMIHCEKGYSKTKLLPTGFTAPRPDDADCETAEDLSEKE